MTKFQPDGRRQLKRFEFPYWDGLNTGVSNALSKRSEPSFLENARSLVIGLLEKRAGHSVLGNRISATSNFGLYDFVNNAHNLIRVSRVGGVVSVYLFNGSTWVKLSGAATNLSQKECDFTTALDRCFIVNGTDKNFYLESNAITAVDSDSSSGFLYNSPTARLINYFRDRVYLGDYKRIDGTRERTGICFSSQPLGIVALVSGDHTQPITTLEVTETKYIKVGAANDSLDVYRGGTLIGTITVTGKTETALTISSFGTNLQSADELWVAGTRNGEKVIRWDNRATGVDAKQYDSFKNASEEDLVLLANVNNNQLIFTENSISVWNSTWLKPLDLNIGCISKKSFVKVLGEAIFLHTTGIYATSGGIPKLISAKIQQVFDNADINQLRNACATTDGISYFVHIGTVTFKNKDGSIKKVMNNVVVEYNMQQNNFFIHTDIPMSHFTTFVGEEGLTLVFAKDGYPSPEVSDTVYIAESITVTIT